MHTNDLIWQQLVDVARSFPLLLVSTIKGMVKPYTADQIEATLRAYLSSAEPKTMRMLSNTWDRQRSLITQQDLIEGATNGTITAATAGKWQDQYAEYVNNKLAPIWRAGGSTASNFIAESIGLNFPNYQPRFPQALERIDNWIKQSGGALIANLSDEQMKAVNAILQHHIVNEPLSATELGKVLRPVVGLTKREAEAVKNRRAKLIKQGMTLAQATRKAATYAAKLHRVRAERIARTELVAGFNQGALAGIKASIDEGTLTDQTVKEWNTSEDERVCTVCAPLHGTTKELDEQFSSRGRTTEVPPIHPSCRCTIIYVIDEDAQLGLTPPAEETTSVRLTDAERRKFVEDTYSDPSLDAALKPCQRF
jgi:SPP1 gp7 family putative phage head morphogenesis protein